MNCTKATICDWCLQEARVQVIEEKLWCFWKIISNEDPSVTSHRNICDKCQSRYERFSIYIHECKINTSKIDELFSTVQVKDEPSIDIEYPPLIKTETSNEVGSNSYGPADKVLSAGKVKKGPLIHIEDYFMNEKDVWKQEASDPDYPPVLGRKGKVGLVLRVALERQVLPDSTVNQKKVNNRTCTYCGKTLSSSLTLKNHLNTHTGDTTFKCSTCNKSFTRLSNLNRHLRFHAGEKPFKCLHCNKSFTRPSDLNIHIRTHTGEKPFKCSQSSKSFTTFNSLNGHLRTHTGEKPFKCSYCNKSFTQMCSLKIHLRTHTGEKPFKCSHCNKRFGGLSNLNRHLRIHTDEKPFKCSHCNKRFVHSTSLKRHSLFHTNDK